MPDTTPERGRVVIYGTGGHARELRRQFERTGAATAAFVDDFDYHRDVDGVTVLPFEEAVTAHADCQWIVAIGAPVSRKKLNGRLADAGLRRTRFVSPGASVERDLRIGEGSQVFHGSTISVGVVLGDFVIVNYGCVLSHDVQVGDFVTISPGVHVAGNVIIETGAYLGVGATVRDGSAHRPLRIGRYSVVGAGACVISDIPPETTVAGVPAKPLPVGSAP